MASIPIQRRRTDLPIESYAAQIAEAVGQGALVLTAEPGAGKTSIVPLLAAEAVAETTGAAAGRVLVLQPRRLAARAAAQRLSNLVIDNSEVGHTVGLTMRGERRVSSHTRIEVMTEAVLTGRLQRDPELPGVAAVIFDEFHERNLHSDLSLAMAIEARATIREDLTLIVMSATLDPGPVADLLGTDNVIEVPGRTFPVETIHLSRPARAHWPDAVTAATMRALDEVNGDVLVFVPGRREIDDIVGRLRPAPVDVIGLHGSSEAGVRRLILSETGPRRVIVATAVAETSVTLPRIEAVVDGGLARQARFDSTTGLGRLETGYVTRFSADQRRGRAGRLQPGRCYRLWSTDDHRHLDDAAAPEIAAGDPLPLAFELARWGDPEANDLPLLDHPGRHRLAAGQALLLELGLVENDGVLSDRGRAAGNLGLHPRLGALLLRSVDLGRLALGAHVAALLDDDRWPATADLGAEVEQRRGELRSRARQLVQRLNGERSRDRNRSRKGKGRRSQAANGSTRLDLRDLAELPALLAAAWPDRVAMRRPNRAGQFLIANGRQASVPPDSELAGADFLVVAEADGIARNATIRRAVAIDRATMLTAVGEHITWAEHVAWDDRADGIRAERQQRLGAIVLHREPMSDAAPELVAPALATGLRQRGLDLLPWNDKALDVRHRLAWLHGEAPDDWPSVDDQSLLSRLNEWLDLSSCRGLHDVRRLNVGAGLLTLLDWQQRSALDQLAPTAVALPGGRSRRLDYSRGRPVLSVRLQHMFGLDHHLVAGPNRAPITIELLSPANRPAQVTTDLPGFWRGSYAAVRAELRGRYPKHQWPERPWEQSEG